ncbi:30S ribosomal protein S1 [Candidatus Berkelbacteria bacterium]|nr:30S ribosomal protein S1 [Candidatus Berkelbacteria bacterium]
MPDSTTAPSPMDLIAQELGANLVPIQQGTTIAGTILSISRNKIVIDVRGIALGFIPAREFSSAIHDFKVGDEISAYVLVAENEDGFVILSLRRADKERYMATLSEQFEAKKPVAVRVKDANRGGLVVEYGNIEGFLPISQLAIGHQPRGGNRDRDVRDVLRDLIGKELSAKIITFDPNNNKIVFSEKAAGDSLAEERANQLTVGEEIEGTVTGIVDFGIFVNIGNLEGLVHISEISWDRVENLDRMFKVGEKVKVQVISVEGGRVSLTIKRLIPDPWQTAIKQFKPGDEVTGTVVRLSTFGAFIDLGSEVVGLMHISEFDLGSADELANTIKPGQTDSFQILSIDIKSRKVALAYTDARRPERAKQAAIHRASTRSQSTEEAPKS